jgi:ABC transporter substrate binding protein
MTLRLTTSTAFVVSSKLAAAPYVDKILKGENPADLPIDQASRFEFIVNMKTAKMLAIEIPTTVLGFASEVIGSVGQHWIGTAAARVGVVDWSTSPTHLGRRPRSGPASAKPNTSRLLFADLRRMPKMGHYRPEMRFCSVSSETSLPSYCS